jgi:hypothetical protein
MGRITEIDFFEAPARHEVARAREAVEERTASGRGRPAGAAPPLDLAALKSRRWVTRPRPHVDRIASAWLIKRFVDPEAEFVFAPPDQVPPDAIPFDMAGVDFGHHGEDCTFETLLRRTGLRDRKLAILAEIVHEADIKDQKYTREEARGIDQRCAPPQRDQGRHEALAHGMICSTASTPRSGSAHEQPRDLGPRATLYLGSLGFGGPVALIGYMQRDLVERRSWFTKQDYFKGLTLSQLAPGPLAAQLAMCLGYVHGGVVGATLIGLAFISPRS